MRTARAIPVSPESNQRPLRYGLPVPGTESIPRLFGTDGIRATAGMPPLDPPTVRRIGAALVRALPRDPAASGAARLLIGRDTRESGGWIESELGHGAGGEGATVTSA